MKIFLLAHSSGIDGPLDYYRDYLLRKSRFEEVFYLSHPLNVYQSKESRFYLNHELIWRKARKGRLFLNLLFDLYYSLKMIRKYEFEVFVAANSFAALFAILGKKIFRKKIPKIIFYPADFSEDRFKNKILNGIYYFMEKIVLKEANLVVNNTQRAKEKRQSLGMTQEKSLLLPNGVYLENPAFLPKEIRKSAFIFVGNVTAEHGLKEMAEILLPRIKELVIIGQGEGLAEIVDLLQKNHISVKIHLQKTHRFVIDYLQSFSGFGLAPYNLTEKWTYYSSPLKVSEYISCGVPVILSNIPQISQLVKDENLGIVYHKEDGTILKELDNFSTQNFYLKAQSFYQRFCWDNLLSKISY